jgi:hypothetical protein
MKNRKNSYQKYDSPGDGTRRTLINRKMFIILDLKGKPLVHRDGHLMIFYRSKEAKSFVFNNKGQVAWRIKRVELDITTL